MCPFPAQLNRQREHRGCYRPFGSKYISVPQATNHVEAVKFAKSIGVPLIAHLTIHWSGTDAWDDPDGTRFAKVREGLAKVLNRRRMAASLETQTHAYIALHPVAVAFGGDSQTLISGHAVEWKPQNQSSGLFIAIARRDCQILL